MVKGRAIAFTPRKTEVAEGVVRHFAAQAMRGRPIFTGPVAVYIQIFQNPPPSWSKKKRAEACFVTGRPDLDNQGKIVLDSCNNIVWRDDAQICIAVIERRYTIDSSERAEVVVCDAVDAPPISIARVA